MGFNSAFKVLNLIAPEVTARLCKVKTLSKNEEYYINYAFTVCMCVYIYIYIYIYIYNCAQTALFDCC